MISRPFLTAFVILLASIPLIPAIPPFWITLLDNVGLAALVVIGLALLTGVGGLTSFGQAAFCGFGAYTSAVLTSLWGWSPWLTLPASLLTSGAAALFLGAITMRLSGHFLPLGTIAWGISLYYIFGKIDFLGRYDGISGVPALSIGSWQMLEPATIYYVIWGFVLLAAIITTNLLDSRMGRAIRALRKGKVAAEAFGVDTVRIKLIVFVHAALLAGLSGWLYAHFQRAVNPSPFGLHAGIEYLFMAVLGGSGHIWGAILGAGLVTLLKDALQRLLPVLVGGHAQMETIFFGLLLVMLLQFARDGLWPHLTARFAPAKRAIKRDAGALLRRSSAPSQDEPSQDHPRPAPRPAPRPNGTPLLQLEAVSKQFGGLAAVNAISFEVKAGQIVALIGPNGAGKSTTFNLITGVLPISMGQIRFNGRLISQTSPQEIARAGIARTFQHVKLMPEMSVLENVALGAHLRGHAGVLASLMRLDRADEDKLLAEAARQIERVGLEEHMHKPAGSLALGQQRIVEIARALCLDPSLLLLDEPAAGLRHFEKQALSALLAQFRREGMSVLLVEHDIGFVMGLADRMVVLDFGTLIAEGAPELIKVHPAVLEAYLGGTT